MRISCEVYRNISIIHEARRSEVLPASIQGAKSGEEVTGELPASSTTQQQQQPCSTIGAPPGVFNLFLKLGTKAIMYVSSEGLDPAAFALWWSPHILTSVSCPPGEATHTGVDNFAWKGQLAKSGVLLCNIFCQAASSSAQHAAGIQLSAPEIFSAWNAWDTLQRPSAPYTGAQH